MTISYNTNWVYGSYQNDLLQFMIKVEALKTNAYFDGSSIAIGIGYDLIQHTNAEIQTDLSITLTSAQSTLLDEARTATAARRKEIVIELGLAITADAAKSSFTNKVAKTYEDRLNTILATTLPDSQEHIALFSMVYNGRLQNYNDIPSAPRILTDLKNALSASNRAEMWYVIRYESGYARNPINADGYATRAYQEANQFSLYNDPNNITDAQAKEIMRMWTMHKDKITVYEQSYPPPVNDSATLQIQPIANYLANTFAPGQTIDNIIVGAGLQSYSYLDKNNTVDTINGTNQNDLIFGEKGNDTVKGGGGNDVIYGGIGDDIILGDAGNDTLYGETGSDTLYGGLGSDTLNGGDGSDRYTFYTGDGQDTITDSDGSGMVFYDSVLLIGGIGKDGNTWQSADGTMTYTKSGSDLVITKTGLALDSMTIKDYFTIAAPPLLAAGQPPLGIKLTSETGYLNGLPTQTITGTAGADTIALLTAGYNYIIYGGDGNDSIDPPGNDIIYGEGGNDMIYGGTGDDRLFGGIGDDLLVGDNAQVYTSPEGQQYNTIDGRDYIEGNEGNDLIMGGFMDDILMGGTGDDTIYGEYDAQYAGKDPVPDTSQDDYIDGGEGNDTIYGKLGNDTLLGGSGDDFISGDIDYYTDSNGNLISIPPGNDIIDGGDGDDTLDGRGSIML